VALADALRGYGRQRNGDTTNISVVDPDGNACVVTTTLGIGSAVWLPGLGVHLNSMLGEGELITGELVPGERMSSMMCPLVVVDDTGDLLLAAGSAGASRIRSALVHTLVAVLLDGVPVEEAVHGARFHVVDDVVHADRLGDLLQERAVDLADGLQRGQLDDAEHLLLEQHGQHHDVGRRRLAETALDGEVRRGHALDAHA